VQGCIQKYAKCGSKSLLFIPLHRLEYVLRFLHCLLLCISRFSPSSSTRPIPRSAIRILTDEQLKRLEQLDQPEPEAQSEPQTLPIGEVEAIANLTTKLDALANVFALVLEGIQEVREYYSADCWLPKREAAERLGISDKRLRSWMDSDELVEGRDFYDATPPGSGSPRWLVNVARTRKKISTSNLFRSARRSPVSAKPKSKARGR
jgi:hypothetical protein